MEKMQLFHIDKVILKRYFISFVVGSFTKKNYSMDFQS